MNQINFNQTGGFPLETDTLDEMQIVSTLLHAQGHLAGNLTILKGCEQTGNTVASGVVHIEGETLDFTGGTIGTNVFIRETQESRIFENGENKPVFTKRAVTFGTAVISWKWADFKRITPNTDIQNMLALLTSKITELEKKTAVFETGGGMVLWNKPANLIPSGWREVTDWRGRIPVGMDAGQTEFNTLGKTGGAKTKQLSVAEMPNHRHSRGAFNLFATKASNIWNSSPSGLDNNNPNSELAVGNLSTAHFDEATEQAVGGNVAFSLLNPYRTVLFIEYQN